MSLSFNASPIARGRTAEIYDWDDRHVLKLYYAWCPPEWADREARIVRAVVAAGIPAPAIDGSVERDGRRGLIYERVTGISMLDDLRRRPWRLLHHARDLAALHAHIHRLPIPELAALRDGLRLSIQRAPHLSEPLRGRLLALLTLLPDGQTLCHGDFHPGNVLIAARGPVVIDWIAASLGNPWADVARTSLLLTVGVRGAGTMVNSTIRLLSALFHRTYLRHYCAQIPDANARLARWLPIVAAARLDERIEPEREALLKMVTEGLRRALPELSAR